MDREIVWTECCVPGATFTLYGDHKVTRTVYLGTMTERLSSETGLPLEWTREYFKSPAEAFHRIDIKAGRL